LRRARRLVGGGEEGEVEDDDGADAKGEGGPAEGGGHGDGEADQDGERVARGGEQVEAREEGEDQPVHRIDVEDEPVGEEVVLEPRVGGGQQLAERVRVGRGGVQEAGDHDPHRAKGRGEEVQGARHVQAEANRGKGDADGASGGRAATVQRREEGGAAEALQRAREQVRPHHPPAGLDDDKLWVDRHQPVGGDDAKVEHKADGREDAALPAERVGESGRLIAHLCAQAERAPEGADHDAVSEERVDEDGEGGGDDAGRPRSSQLDEGARLGVIGAEFAATTHQGRGRSATGQRRRPDCRCPRRERRRVRGGGRGAVHSEWNVETLVRLHMERAGAAV